MRADRLLRILHCLQTNRLTSARELAAQLEVSERTVHRDMEALAAAGFPVYAERGPRGGWMLPEGYRTRLTGLTSAEIAGLIALQSSSAVGDLKLAGEAGNAIAKLAAALPAPARDEADFVRKHLHIDGAGWHDAREPAPYLELVQQAVWERRKLRIRYVSAEGRDGTESVVRPWGLVAKRHTWYFAAVKDACEPEGRPAAEKTNKPAAVAEKPTEPRELPGEAGTSGMPEPRTYRVSRLAAVELLEERFEVPDGFDLGRWWERSVARFRSELPVYPARVLVREAAWHRFSRENYIRVRKMHTRDDGWVDTEADFHTLDSAVTLLLGYGASVRVLSPEALARSVESEAKALLALYEGPDSAPHDQGHIYVN